MDHYKNLDIWKLSVKLTVRVYKLINDFPSSEKFGLASQLSRSVNSIGANIAESSGRFHKKDKINFLYHSRGSLVETEHHLFVAKELGFISDKEMMSIAREIQILSVKLNNFINSFK